MSTKTKYQVRVKCRNCRNGLVALGSRSCPTCEGHGSILIDAPFVREGMSDDTAYGLQRRWYDFKKRVADFNRKEHRKIIRQIYSLSKTNRRRYIATSEHFRMRTTSNDVAVQLSLLGADYELLPTGAQIRRNQ